MSTVYTDRAGDVIARRWFGGIGRGPVLTVYVPQSIRTQFGEQIAVQCPAGYQQTLNALVAGCAKDGAEVEFVTPGGRSELRPLLPDLG